MNGKGNLVKGLESEGKVREFENKWLLSIGVDYVVIGFDMEVQPLVTHNAAWPLCVSAICIDVVSNHLLFAHML